MYVIHHPDSLIQGLAQSVTQSHHAVRIVAFRGFITVKQHANPRSVSIEVDDFNVYNKSEHCHIAFHMKQICDAPTMAMERKAVIAIGVMMQVYPGYGKTVLAMQHMMHVYPECGKASLVTYQVVTMGAWKKVF